MNPKLQLRTNREQRFLVYIAEAWTKQDIADREGMEADYAGKLRQKIAAKHGLSVPKDGVGKEFAFGLNNEENHRVRSRLADKLHNLRLNHDEAEVAYMIGIPQRVQRDAYTRPFPYNWTLSQMQRLAAAEGKTFLQLMTELTR